MRRKVNLVLPSTPRQAMVSSCWAQRPGQSPQAVSSHSKQPFRRVHQPAVLFPVQRVYFNKAVPFTASRIHVTINLKLLSLHFQLSHDVDGADTFLFVCGRQTCIPYKQIFTQCILSIIPWEPDASHSRIFPSLLCSVIRWVIRSPALLVLISLSWTC